jgi:hypothetical protein
MPFLSLNDRDMKFSFARALLLATLMLMFHTTSPGQITDIKEYQIKAVFLFNFAQFVEWPETALPESSDLVIGVLGEDLFGDYLDEIVRGETVNGHPLKVKHFKDIGEVENCHILFINLKNAESLKHALSNLKDTHILTVGDTLNFAREGGMIQFFTQNNKVHLKINLEKVKNNELAISAKLLRVAEIVKNANN